MCSKFPSCNSIGDLFFFLFVSHFFCDFCWWWTCFPNYQISFWKVVFHIARHYESLTKAGEYRKINKFSKSNHCFIEITSLTWKFRNFFCNNHKLSVLRCLVSLTIIAFVYNTAIQLAARLRLSHNVLCWICSNLAFRLHVIRLFYYWFQNIYNM